MNRREFSKSVLMLGIGAQAGFAQGNPAGTRNQPTNYYEEPAKKLPVRKFDVVVAGGGTAGVVAATAAAPMVPKRGEPWIPLSTCEYMQPTPILPSTSYPTIRDSSISLPDDLSFSPKDRAVGTTHILRCPTERPVSS